MTLKSPVPVLSFDSVLLTALVERQPRTSLSFKHLISPHNALSDPVISNARHALLSAPHLLFPTDLPAPLDEPQDEDEDNDRLEPRSVPSAFPTPNDQYLSPPVHADVAAPPPLRLSRTRSPISSSPVSDSPPPSPRGGAEAQLNRAVDLARTLPLSCAGVYNALAESSAEMRPALKQPLSLRHIQSRTQTALHLSVEPIHPTRSNSVPRRPSSSPPPRIRSLGLPMYAREQAAFQVDERRDHSSHSQRAPEMKEWHSIKKRRSFRHVLLNAKTHTFAVTARDGSRQYVYCRPLSHTHAMVVLTTATHTGYYVSALERIAARYALLVDEIVELQPVCSGNGGMMLQTAKERWQNFLRFELLRCPPQVAKELTRSLLEWLRTGSAGGISLADDGLLRRTRSRIFRDNPEFAEDDAFHTDEEGHSITWITSSATSSNRSSRAKEDTPAHRALDEPNVPHKETDWFGWRKERTTDGLENSGGTGDLNTPLPWELEAAASGEPGPERMARVLELTDATILFRHFPVRSLMSIIVAVLEERRVCLVGPNTALVTRAVLALDNLLRPFEWPHTVSPVLLDHMLPVLGAPFPYLVGILCDQLEQTHELGLDEVIFGNLTTGKVTATTDIGELHRHIPRRIRNRFEKRLTKIKNSCIRQVSRSSLSPFVPSVSNTATSYFECDTYDCTADGKARPLLFRSKSQLRLVSTANPQNVWLDPDTVHSLDRTMRKFFAELLEELPALRKEGNADAEPTSVENILEKVAQLSTPSVPGFSLGSAKPEGDRRQLLRAFTETQMFMQWERSEAVDPTFGITKSDASRLRIRSGRTPSTLVKDEDYMSEAEERIQTAENALSDYEFAEDPDMLDFDEFVKDVRAARRSRRKAKNRNRPRIHFTSDVEDAGVSRDGIFSDVETSDRRPRERPFKLRQRNASTECLADQESEASSKRMWLSIKLPSARRPTSRDATPAMVPLKQVSAEDAFDQLEAEYTEAEDSDDFSDNGHSGFQKNYHPIDRSVFSRGRARVWTRRGRHAIRT